VFDYELQKFNKLEEVNLSSEKDNLIGLIFERIFRSQDDNLTQTHIFAAHILNQFNNSNFGDDGLP